MRFIVKNKTQNGINYGYGNVLPAGETVILESSKVGHDAVKDLQFFEDRGLIEVSSSDENDAPDPPSQDPEETKPDGSSDVSNEPA